MKQKELHDKFMQLEPIDLFAYEQDFPEFKPLRDCIQGKKWHAEGDVFVHTKMSVDEAWKIIQGQTLHKNPGFDLAAKQNIYIGAMLHDFGKPLTTIIHEGPEEKITAHGHDVAGTVPAREFLKKYFPEFNFARREWIINLVEHHMQPQFMVKDGADDLRFKRFSLEVDTEQVYNVEIAEHLGRIGYNMDQRDVYMDGFKQKCQELDIFGKNWVIPNSDHLSNFAYANMRWKILFNHMNEYDSNNMKVIEKLMAKDPFELMLTVGIPGSGKSTYTQKFHPNVERISMDDERERLCGTANDMSRNGEVFNNCFAKLNKVLSARQNVIWDATSWTRKARKVLIDSARKKGAVITIVYFDTPLELALQRNQIRDRHTPEDVIKMFYSKLQAPKPYEYDRLVVVEK